MNDEPEIVETDTLPTGDVGADIEAVTPNGGTNDMTPNGGMRGAQTQEELDKAVRDHIINDFEQALNLIVKYQKVVDRLQSVDPNWDEARPLLNKYRFTPHEPNKAMRVYDGTRDITYHADSIPGTAEEQGGIPDKTVGERKELGEYHEETVDADEVADPVTRMENEARYKVDEENEAERKLAEKLVEEGYEPCPICDGTGVAQKGVLKGRACGRCNELGFWKPPERAELIADEDGNVRLRPIQKGTQTHPGGAGRPIPEDD